MNVEFFLDRQISELKREGHAALWRKVQRLGKALTVAVLMILIFPVAVVLWMLRPVRVFRFGQLPSSRIGHLVYEPELYLLKLADDSGGANYVDCLYTEDVVCNYALLQLWRRRLRILGTSAVRKEKRSGKSSECSRDE